MCPYLQLVLSLVAATQAEADPAFAYSFGGHLLPYAVHHAPLVHAPVVYTHHTGCTNSVGAVVPCALPGLSVLGVAPVAAAAPAAPVEAVDRKKREAEADPEAEADAEADPWVYYSTHGYWPVGYSHYAHYAPLAYSGHHYGYYGLGHPLGYYGKRSAEPEAEAAPEADAEADPWLVYGLGYGGHVYGGHYGYGYHHALPYYYLGGCRNYLGAAVPCA